MFMGITRRRAAAGLGIVFGIWCMSDAWAQEPSVEHGRYISVIGGCNDCHTPGYLLAEGKVPEAQWLTGDRFGWRGPWGTTYAANLRMLLATMSEDQWVELARTLKTRPPMPWFGLNQMHENDLRSLYRFIRQLGPAGEAAPAYVPPDREPPPPFASFPPGPPENGTD
jgi:mono/diheme cytochrome c family protein